MTGENIIIIFKYVLISVAEFCGKRQYGVCIHSYAVTIHTLAEIKVDSAYHCSATETPADELSADDPRTNKLPVICKQLHKLCHSSAELSPAHCVALSHTSPNMHLLKSFCHSHTDTSCKDYFPENVFLRRLVTVSFVCGWLIPGITDGPSSG